MSRLGFPPWAQNLRAEINISDFQLPLPMSETHSDNVEMSCGAAPWKAFM